MKITKQQWLGVIRQILTLVGSLIASYGITQIGGMNTESVTGTVLVIVVTAWGIIDKTNADSNAWYSLFRHLLSVLSGVLVYVLPEKSDLINTIIPSVLSILAILFSYNANTTKL